MFTWLTIRIAEFDRSFTDTYGKAVCSEPLARYQNTNGAKKGNPGPS